MRIFRTLCVILAAVVLTFLAAQTSYACPQTTQTAAQQSWATVTLDSGRSISSANPAFLTRTWVNLATFKPASLNRGYPLARQGQLPDGTYAEQVIYYPDPAGSDGLVYLVAQSGTRKVGVHDIVGRWYTATLELNTAMRDLIASTGASGVAVDAETAQVTVAPPASTFGPATSASAVTESAPTVAPQIDAGSLYTALGLITCVGGAFVLYLLFRAFAARPAVAANRPSSESRSEAQD